MTTKKHLKHISFKTTQAEKAIARGKQRVWPYAIAIGIIAGAIGAILMINGMNDFYSKHELYFRSPITIQNPVVYKTRQVSKAKHVKSANTMPLKPTLTPTPTSTPTPVAKPKVSSFKKYLTDQGAANREWVLNYAKTHYSGDELIAFDNILKKEAGYRPDALNEIGAGGIAQAYPHTKMGCPLTQEGLQCQVDWFISYLENRYQGSPLIAWEWHLTHGWY